VNIKKTGWLLDTTDANDYGLKTDRINALVRQIQILRGFDEFLGSLGSLETTSSPARDIQRIFAWRSLGNIQIKVKGDKISLRAAIALLRKDIEIISRGLTSGIDLVAVSPHPSSTRFRPLIPPISSRVFKIVDEKNEIIKKYNLDKENYDAYNDINDPDLVKVQQFLYQIAPIARYVTEYGRGSDLEEALQQLIQDPGSLSQSPSPDSDLPPKEPRPENIIKIDPRTMYSLLGKEELEKSENSPPASQDKIDSIDYPPLQIPLNGNLSNQLRKKNAQDIILPDQDYILPGIVDLSYWCSEVKDQGEFNSCTSHAVTSLVEYFQNRLSDRSSPNFTPASLSARFLYKVTRHLKKQEEAHRTDLKEMLRNALLDGKENIEERSEKFLNDLDALSLNFSEQRHKIVKNIKEDRINDFLAAMFDVGASIRQTLKALQLFGIPPARYWPDLPDIDTFEFNDEPHQFCYAFAQNYQTIKYFRLDSLDLTQENGKEGHNKTLVLTQIKAVLAAGFPAVCGFLYDPENDDDNHDNSENNDNNRGMILLPSLEKIQAFENFKANQDKLDDKAEILGHAVLVVGYSDIKEAFLFQNSYGKQWGDGGYGWLPYEFVLQDLAIDWWSLLNSEWVEVGDFGLDSSWGGKPKTLWG
jgi:C1A family cysteine protease